MSCLVQDVVADACGRAILFPRATVPADGDARFGPSINDYAMASSGVIGAVSHDRANFFILGDLCKQVRQQRAVALSARREFDGPDVASLSIHADMDFAPRAMVA